MTTKRTIQRCLQTTFLICFGILLLNSCNSEPEKEINPTISFMQFQSYRKLAIHSFFRASEKQMELRELATGESYQDRTDAAQLLFKATTQIENEYEAVLRAIHKEKEVVLKKLGASKALSKQDPKHPKPSLIDGSLLTKDQDISYDPKKLLRKILHYRDQVTKTIASSQLVPKDTTIDYNPEYSFDASDIKVRSQNGSEEKQLNKACEKAYQDDRHGIKSLFLGLTPFAYEIQPYTALEALHYISILEGRVCEAYAQAISVIRLRVATENYSFDRILPVVNAPDVVKKGETFNLEVYMAAYDSYKNPILTSNEGTVLAAQFGKGKVELKLDETRTITGTICIRNKSGVRKLMQWEKKIVVQ